MVGEKRQLVFYDGKPPYGKKTKWIMHEYKLNRCQSSEDGRNANKDPMKVRKTLNIVQFHDTMFHFFF